MINSLLRWVGWADNIRSPSILFIKSELHFGRFATLRNSLILCYKISVDLILVTFNPTATVRLEPSHSSSVQSLLLSNNVY